MTTRHRADSIYLDNNATTHVLPEVAEAMDEAQRAGYANPASQHQAGQRARRKLEAIREEFACLLGAQTAGERPDRLIFTSGGTESNNLALRGLARGRTGNLLVSGTEHPSALRVAEELGREGFELRRVPVTELGVLQLGALAELLDGQTRLVSLVWGNHETGVLQPLREVADLCTAGFVPLHVDAVQVVGKLPVNFHELGAAAMSLAAHKFHGPLGIGALLVRGDVVLEPLLLGGFQQGGLRPGTQSVPLALGMLVALRHWSREADARQARLTSLRDLFEHELQTALPTVLVNGGRSNRLPHTSNVAFPGIDRQQLFLALDVAGVACSTGSACASGSSEPSPVLRAMGLPESVVQSSLRFSFGALTTESEVVEAVSRIRQVHDALRGRETSQKRYRPPPQSRVSAV